VKKLSILGKLTSLTLALVLLVTAVPTLGFSSSDLAGHFAERQMEEFFDRGLIRTFDDGTARPDYPMTRAEMYSMINRVFGFRETAVIGFVDVTPDDWYFVEIARAMAAGYIIGADSAESLPFNTVTRAEAAAILVSVAGLTPFAGGAEQFRDVSAGSWGAPYIGAAVSAGLMNGHADGSFRPDANITRAEMVIASIRAMDRLGRPLPDMSPNASNAGFRATDPMPATSSFVDQGPVSQPAPFMENVPSAPAFTGSVPRQSDFNFSNFAQTISSSNFGGPLGNRVINGDVLVDVSTGIIRDLDIRGNLVFSDRTSGTFTLTDVHVSGNIYVFGNPRIAMDNSSARELIVNGRGTGTSVSLRRLAEIPTTRVFSAVTLSESNVQSLRGFSSIVIENGFDRGARVSLAGNFNRVDVLERADLRLERGNISRLTIDSRADRTSVEVTSSAVIDATEVNGVGTRFTGSGRVRNADVRVSGVTFSRRPDSLFGSQFSSWWGDRTWWGVGDHHLRIQVIGWGGELLRDAVVEISVQDRGSRHVITSGWTDRNGEFNTWLPSSWWGDDLYRITVRWGGEISTWTFRAWDMNRTIRIDFPSGNWSGGGGGGWPSAQTRTVGVNAGGAPGVAVSGSGSYVVGNTVSVSVTGREGHEFAGWNVTGGPLSGGFNHRDMSTSFTMPNNNVTLSATWIAISGAEAPSVMADAVHAASLTATTMAVTNNTTAAQVLTAVTNSVTGLGTGRSMVSGTGVTVAWGSPGFTMVPATASTNGSITGIIVLNLAGTASQSINVNLVIPRLSAGATSYRVNISSEGQGTVGASAVNVAHGETVEVWARPDAGHRVRDWNANGTILPGVTTDGRELLEVFTVTENLNIRVRFEPIPGWTPNTTGTIPGSGIEIIGDNLNSSAPETGNSGMTFGNRGR